MDNKKQIINSEVVMNHIEARYEEEVAINMERMPHNHIYFVEGFRQKKNELKTINAAGKKLKSLRENYPQSKVMPVFQFNQGTRRTDAQLDAINEAEKESDYAGIYEKHSGQDSTAYEGQLNKKIFLKGEKKAIAIFEVESNGIAAKIQMALKCGVRHFVILGMGNKYNDDTFWSNKILNPIQKAGGIVTSLLLKRMNNSRESYIKGMVQKGVNHIVHGSLNPYQGEDEIELLYLDPEDMTYRTLSEVRNQSVIEAVKACKDSKQYGLSRVLTIYDANIFAKSHPTEIFVED